MGIATYPAPSSGGIKSVQRGSAAGAGNVTITAVDISKSFVTVFGTSSSGTVAATGSVSGITGNINAATGTVTPPKFGGVSSGNWGYFVDNANNSNRNMPASLNATSFSGNASNISGGTNNLVAAVVTGYLSNSTTLVVSGACRWEVVEFN